MTSPTKQPPPLIVPAHIRDAGLPLAQFRALCQVASRCGKDGQCFESLPRMAKACRIRRDTLQRALQMLVLNHWLIREERRGDTTIYRLSQYARTGRHAPEEWLSVRAPVRKQKPMDNDENENNLP